MYGLSELDLRGGKSLESEPENPTSPTTTPPDFTEQVGTAASWEDEARRLLTACCYVINGLADQQAMPDNSHQQLLKSIGDLLQQPPIPAEHPQQDWCDHCSGDLEQPVPEVKGRTTTHVICEKCYRKLAGPRWFDPDFDPTKGSPETPWLTEQARQLVKQWLESMPRSPAGTMIADAWIGSANIESLERLVATFAAEAATRGQSVGIERARQKVAESIDSHIARWRMLDDEVELWKVDSLRTELTAEIHQMSPDPSYLDRVRSEAATAALEQAVQVAEDYFTLKGNVWVEKYGNVKLEDAIRAIAAIGDDRR